jgi:hypothetical protein
MPEPRRLDVEFLSYDAIAGKVEGFRQQHPRAHSVPVDIEAVADLDLRMNIAPHPGLYNLGIPSCLSGDMSTIWVEEHLCENVEVRYRFSLAHEVGHLVLHKRIWETFDYTDVPGWRRT